MRIADWVGIAECGLAELRIAERGTGTRYGVQMEVKMDELVFLVEAAPEGGFTARALGAAIFTEADDRETLRRFILDAVDCHYEPEERPRSVLNNPLVEGFAP